MNENVKKTYTASSKESYDALLNTIYGNGYYVDILTDRKNLKVTVIFDKDDREALEDLADIAEEGEFEISDAAQVFSFSEASQVADIEASVREEMDAEIASLKKKLQMATADKDHYRNRFDKSVADMSAIKVQMRAIATLLTMMAD